MKKTLISLFIALSATALPACDAGEEDLEAFVEAGDDEDAMDAAWGDDFGTEDDQDVDSDIGGLRDNPEDEDDTEGWGGGGEDGSDDPISGCGQGGTGDDAVDPSRRQDVPASDLAEWIDPDHEIADPEYDLCDTVECEADLVEGTPLEVCCDPYTAGINDFQAQPQDPGDIDTLTAN